ncbi:MAG: A/G-specific adenine glycosylase [Beggiatoa sp. IS2]|nr:MAG: A/G-specific adenine glycosylase [Beggiatoa sp. IS2]
MNFDNFSNDVLTWFDAHGRKDLPWQAQTPYHIWMSEIMLQQTQVNTVIPYYQRFIQRFPDVQTLAESSLDEVLHHWSGLGYYARARNLHQTAQQIATIYHGVLPADLETLLQLPGIGRSTAGAILALAYQQRQAILDGNVKRLLCRYHAIRGWPGTTLVAQQLWQLAEQYLPFQRIADYTQALMDLGATLCTPHAPRCLDCPLAHHCLAHQQGQEIAYPTPKPRKILPVKTTIFMIVQNIQGEVLLQQRPLQGIWGGLWSFPECPNIEAMSGWCQQYLKQKLPIHSIWQPLRHTFTHFHLDITPVHLLFKTENCQNIILPSTLWYNMNQPLACGLATPVARLLAQLAISNTGELLL